MLTTYSDIGILPGVNIGGIRVLALLAFSWVMLSGFCWSMKSSAEKADEAVQSALSAGDTQSARQTATAFKKDCEAISRSSADALQIYEEKIDDFKRRIEATERQKEEQGLESKKRLMLQGLGDSTLECKWDRWSAPKEGPCAYGQHERNICAHAGAGENALVLYAFCGEKVKSVEDLVRIKNECKSGEIELLNKQKGDIAKKPWPGDYCFPFPRFESLDKERQLKEFCANLEMALEPAIRENRLEDARGLLTTAVEASRSRLEWIQSGEELAAQPPRSPESLAPMVKTIVEAKWKPEFAGIGKIPASKTPSDLQEEIDETDTAVQQEREKLFLSLLAPQVDKWLEAAWQGAKARIEKEKTARIKQYLSGNISKCAKLASRQHELVTHAKRCKQYGCPPAEWGKITTQLEPIDEELATLTDEFRRGMDEEVPELKALKQKAYTAGCLF